MTGKPDTPVTAQPASRAAAGSPSAAPSSLPRRNFGSTFAAGVLYVLLLDAVLETWLAGSPVRVAAAVTVAVYVAVSVLVRGRLAVGARIFLSLLVLLGLLAFSAWTPRGLSAGIVMLRQPPGTVLAALTAVAIVLAGWSCVRLKRLPVVAKIIVGWLAAYGAVAMTWAIAVATPYAALLHGQSLWVRLPVWLQGAAIGGLVVLPAGFVLQVAAAAGGPRGRLRRVNLLLALTSACSLAIVAAGLFVRPGSGGTPADAGQNGPGLQRITVATLQLPVPRTFDLTHVSPEYFAAALGNDPVRIFEFVRDQVAYEPYVGSLRGPRGTLMALAGNSVDRAALLVSLLTHAGQPARFVHGQLPDSRVQDLVASLFAERPEEVPPRIEASGPAKAAADLLAAGIDRDERLLASSLKNAGLPSRAEVTTLASLVEETRDHYWVQWWRDGTWVDMDTSFAAATPGTTYAPALATFDTLPDALFHRVDIRIRLEEYTGATSSTRDILQYSAPAADLSAVDLVLAHVTVQPPSAAGGSGLGAFAPRNNAAGQTGQVRPVLVVNGQAVAGSSFWQIPPRQQTRATFDGLLGGGEEPEAPVAVAVAETLEFEFVAPGGRKDSVVCEVFDLVGPARRRQGEKLEATEVSALTRTAGSRPLTQVVHEFLVTTGSLHPAHLANIVSAPASEEAEPLDLQAALRRVNILFVTTSDQLLDRIAAPGGGICRFYVDSPRVHIAELAVGPSDVRLSMDLRRDRLRAVGARVPKEYLFGAQVLRGVIDGHLERTLIDYLNSPDIPGNTALTTAMSTSLAFELAHASKVPTVLLEKDTAALAVDVPADGRARLEEALAAGWVALAPKGPVAVGGVPRFAWWQVDRRSGSTIPVTDAGLHQATVDLVIVESRENGKVVVFEGAAPGQGALSRACAHPTNFQNAQKAYQYVNYLINLMKSNSQAFSFTHYLTDFAL